MTNWGDDNRALTSRGEVTLWLHEDVLRDLRAVGGRGMLSSDAAILCALRLRAVFKLALQLAQGFLNSLKTLPGFTTSVQHSASLAPQDAVHPLLFLRRFSFYHAISMCSLTVRR